MRANTVKMREQVGRVGVRLDFSPVLHRRSESVTSTQAVILTLLLH